MVIRRELTKVGFWFGLAVLALILLEGGSKMGSAQSIEGAEFAFTFANDDEGWITGFADLPFDADLEIYELESGFRQLPEGLEGNGIFLQGHNRSDDLFMFLKRQVTGLQTNMAHEVAISLDLATNVPATSFGIGGSPGESVYVKAGASAVEPMVAENDSGWLRMNIDKGNQAPEGESTINLGNVANPEVAGDEYKLKTLNNEGRPLEVTTDDQGRAWMIVGAASGFEGLSTFYYSKIIFVFTSLKPPSVGDFTLPKRVFSGAAVLGMILVGFGISVLARKRLRPASRP